MSKTTILAGVVVVLCVAVAIVGWKWWDTHRQLQDVLEPLPPYDPIHERVQDKEYMSTLMVRRDEQQALAMEGEALQRRLRKIIDEMSEQIPELKETTAQFYELEEALGKVYEMPETEDRSHAVGQLRHRMMQLGSRQLEIMENAGNAAYTAVMEEVADHSRRVQEHQRGTERFIGQKRAAQDSARAEEERRLEERRQKRMLQIQQ